MRGKLFRERLAILDETKTAETAIKSINGKVLLKSRNGKSGIPETDEDEKREERASKH